MSMRNASELIGQRIAYVEVAGQQLVAVILDDGTVLAPRTNTTLIDDRDPDKAVTFFNSAPSV